MNVDNWLTDIVKRQAFVSRDIYGKVTYAAEETIFCRIEREQKMVLNTEGQEVMTDTQLAAKVSFNIEDRVWFPDLVTGLVDTSDVNNARQPVAIPTALDRSRELRLFEVSF